MENKKRDIGQEILEGIRTIKNGEGKKYWVYSEYNKCKTAVAVKEARD